MLNMSCRSVKDRQSKETQASMKRKKDDDDDDDDDDIDIDKRGGRGDDDDDEAGVAEYERAPRRVDKVWAESSELYI